MALDQVVLDKLQAFKTLWDNSSAKTKEAASDLIIKAVDDLINFVEVTYNIPGADKKTIVINAVDMLYDYTLGSVLPLWMKPISGVIKSLIINEFISLMIDFFVSKYNAGVWKATS